MITAEKLKTLISFTSKALSAATGYGITEAKFLGITNGGQFCYSVDYHDDALGEDVKGKVFLSYDSGAGKINVELD